MTTTLTPPFAVSFGSVAPVLTEQGHRIRPLIDGRPSPEGNVPDLTVSMGGLEVPPGFIAKPHWHPHTDVIVHVTACGPEGALTLYGTELEYWVIQHAGDLLPIQKGWYHTVVNLSLATKIRAYESRGNCTVLDDNPLVPNLQPLANLRGAQFLVDVHGRPALTRFHDSQAAKAAAALDAEAEARAAAAQAG